MEIIIFQVDAFTDKAFGGNPAAVVPDASELNDDQMQAIAKEMNLSETAFIIPKGKNNYDVRFFTPACEVDLCGHATIAAFYTLAHKGYINGIDNGVVEVHQDTKAGKLPVEIHYKDAMVNKIMMSQGKPRSLGYISETKELCSILGIKEDDLGTAWKNIKPEIITTGLPDIIVPVKNMNVLSNLKVDYSRLSKFSSDLDVTGAHVFTIEDEKANSLDCRNFAPLVGIQEESATGTANGALLYYLKRNNVIDKNNIIAMQGQTLNRPSKIYCEIEKCNNEEIVKVGGKATIILEGIISI